MSNQKDSVELISIKCAQCPAFRSEKVPGISDGYAWFCSRICLQAYNEELRMDECREIKSN